MKVRAAPQEHFHWLVKRTGLQFSSAFRAIEAVDDSGRIHGMVGYDDWTPNSVAMHVAIDNPAALRTILRHAFVYPFVEAGRGIALALVPGWNAKSLRIATSVGFKEVHRVRDGWDHGVDMVVHEMRLEDCRWLGGDNGR